MRIISGLYKGRILKSARHLNLRPATDRVKETIFNILQNRLRLEGSEILDLFAGTGSLGIEALSRGAAHIIFVDNSADSLQHIKENTTILDCTNKCKFIKSDALKYTEQMEETFDLIFADPPYVYEFTTTIPEKVFTNNLLNTGGFLIIEHTKKMIFENSDKYIQSIKKDFGNTVVSFFVHNIMEKK